MKNISQTTQNQGQGAVPDRGFMFGLRNDSGFLYRMLSGFFYILSFGQFNKGVKRSQRWENARVTEGPQDLARRTAAADAAEERRAAQQRPQGQASDASLGDQPRQVREVVFGGNDFNVASRDDTLGDFTTSIMEVRLAAYLTKKLKECYEAEQSGQPFTVKLEGDFIGHIRNRLTARASTIIQDGNLKKYLSSFRNTELQAERVEFTFPGNTTESTQLKSALEATIKDLKAHIERTSVGPGHGRLTDPELPSTRAFNPRLAEKNPPSAVVGSKVPPQTPILRHPGGHIDGADKPSGTNMYPPQPLPLATQPRKPNARFELDIDNFVTLSDTEKYQAIINEFRTSQQSLGSSQTIAIHRGSATAVGQVLTTLNDSALTNIATFFTDTLGNGSSEYFDVQLNSDTYHNFQTHKNTVMDALQARIRQEGRTEAGSSGTSCRATSASSGAPLRAGGAEGSVVHHNQAHYSDISSVPDHNASNGNNYFEIGKTQSIQNTGPIALAAHIHFALTHQDNRPFIIRDGARAEFNGHFNGANKLTDQEKQRIAGLEGALTWFQSNTRSVTSPINPDNQKNLGIIAGALMLIEERQNGRNVNIPAAMGQEGWEADFLGTPFGTYGRGVASAASATEPGAKASPMFHRDREQPVSTAPSHASAFHPHIVTTEVLDSTLGHDQTKIIEIGSLSDEQMPAFTEHESHTNASSVSKELKRGLELANTQPQAKIKTNLNFLTFIMGYLNDYDVNGSDRQLTQAKTFFNEYPKNPYEIVPDDQRVAFIQHGMVAADFIMNTVVPNLKRGESASPPSTTADPLSSHSAATVKATRNHSDQYDL